MYFGLPRYGSIFKVLCLSIYQNVIFLEDFSHRWVEILKEGLCDALIWWHQIKTTNWFLPAWAGVLLSLSFHPPVFESKVGRDFLIFFFSQRIQEFGYQFCDITRELRVFLPLNNSWSLRSHGPVALRKFLFLVRKMISERQLIVYGYISDTWHPESAGKYGNSLGCNRWVSMNEYRLNCCYGFKIILEFYMPLL